MIKILIVDDEPVICQGLSQTIPWEEVGAHIVGIAYNGEKALQMISDLEVDIVITDVKMPIMDGLELVIQLRKMYSPVYVIMISGYEEFNYVKHAIRYGVKDYLLKPVNVNELLDLVKRLIHDKALLKKQEEKINKEKMRHLIYRALLESILDPRIYEELRDSMGNKHVYRVIVCEMDRYADLLLNQGQTIMEDFRESWLQQMNKVLNDKSFEHICIFLHQNQLLALCYSEGRNSLSEEKLYLNFMKYNQDNLFPYSIYWSLSDIFEQVSDLHQAYQQAVSMLDSRQRSAVELFLTPRSLSDAPEELLLFKILPEHYEEDIIKFLFQHNYKSLTDSVELTFHYFVSEDYLLHEAFQACQEICHVVYRKLRELGMYQIGPYDSYFYTLDLRVQNTLESLERIFMEEMSAIYEMIMRKNHGKNVWVKEIVLKYIANHYHEDIKASEIAEKIKITPNYFSLIFKQETGKNYNEYLNDVRIEEAKKMLVNSYDRIFEIAEKVGYNDYKYFVNNFKKKVGVTPTEYRNSKIFKV